MEETISKVWRIRLRPGEEPKNQFGFCFQRHIIGIGWGIEPWPTDAADYLKRGNKKYGNSDSWQYASAAICDDGTNGGMSDEDFVWAINHKQESPDDFRYFLGKIKGKWEYRDGDEYQRAGIHNIRQCKLYETRVEDYDGGGMRSVLEEKFKGSEHTSHTLEEITNANEHVEEWTRNIWEKIQGQNKGMRGW